ncbi:unnamed protein product [Rotaria sordida]|uniref:Uncharacterized protein n=1 Tax=Rotaria sordida TaxID=392033 RepID=A0A813UL77_9BILA|nr:unnamed protein product [Rotaria sordida]CAF0829224.1 unnamed protein product [Rotaria sordida]
MNIIPGIIVTESCTVSILPALFYILICLKTKADTQITIGAIMTAIYALVMSMIQVLFFLPSVAATFIVTDRLHRNEMFNLLHGFLYLIRIPGDYLLVTYALCN